MFEQDIKKGIRTIVDYPKKGINFRDVTTVLQDKVLFSEAIYEMKEKISNLDFDIIVGPESRGFIFGTPLAYALGKGFVPVRKPGKLPSEVISEEYDLEYGKDKLEIHKDSIKPGDKVVIVDDLMATGGTMGAIIKLVERLGGEVVGICTLIELPELEGRKKLEGYNFTSVVSFMEDELDIENEKVRMKTWTN